MIIFPVIIYVLIGLAISSFIYGAIGDEFDDLYIITGITWPIVIIGFLIILFVKLFYKLGEYFKEKF